MQDNTTLTNAANTETHEHICETISGLNCTRAEGMQMGWIILMPCTHAMTLHDNRQPASVYSKGALELDDKLPVILGHVILEVLFQQVNGLPGDLADERILHKDIEAS